MFPAPSWGPADSAMSRHPNQPSAKKAAVAGRIRICVCAYQKISTNTLAKHIITYPLRGRGEEVEGGVGWMSDGRTDRDHFLWVPKEIAVVTWPAGLQLVALLFNWRARCSSAKGKSPDSKAKRNDQNKIERMTFECSFTSQKKKKITAEFRKLWD